MEVTDLEPQKKNAMHCFHKMANKSNCSASWSKCVGPHAANTSELGRSASLRKPPAPVCAVFAPCWSKSLMAWQDRICSDGALHKVSRKPCGARIPKNWKQLYLSHEINDIQFNRYVWSGKGFSGIAPTFQGLFLNFKQSLIISPSSPRHRSTRQAADPIKLGIYAHRRRMADRVPAAP